MSRMCLTTRVEPNHLGTIASMPPDAKKTPTDQDIAQQHGPDRCAQAIQAHLTNERSASTSADRQMPVIGLAEHDETFRRAPFPDTLHFSAPARTQCSLRELSFHSILKFRTARLHEA
jgi:hypothetical protein